MEPDNDRTVLIDASTAFRVDENWTYGFPGKKNSTCQSDFLETSILVTYESDGFRFSYKELSKDQRAELGTSKRISNPGCYPTGFIGLTRPLVDAGILPEGTPLTVNAISGYSGGGKALMNIFEDSDDHEPWSGYGFALVGILQYFYSFCHSLSFAVSFSQYYPSKISNINTFPKWQSIRNWVKIPYSSLKLQLLIKEWWCLSHSIMLG